VKYNACRALIRLRAKQLCRRSCRRSTALCESQPREKFMTRILMAIHCTSESTRQRLSVVVTTGLMILLLSLCHLLE